MLSKYLMIAAVALSAIANAGETMITVEHGDGHVDNTVREAGTGIADIARLHHEKIHTGRGLSDNHLVNDHGEFHRQDLGLGEHENILHESLNDHDHEHDHEHAFVGHLAGDHGHGLEEVHHALHGHEGHDGHGFGHDGHDDGLGYGHDGHGHGFGHEGHDGHGFGHDGHEFGGHHSDHDGIDGHHGHDEFPTPFDEHHEHGHDGAHGHH